MVKRNPQLRSFHSREQPLENFSPHIDTFWKMIWENKIWPLRYFLIKHHIFWAKTIGNMWHTVLRIDTQSWERKPRVLTSAQITMPDSAAMISVRRRTGHPWNTASMTAWAALDESSFLTMNTTPGDSTTG